MTPTTEATIAPVHGGLAQPVNRLQPRGKTPLSAAVQQAAEALKYTEKRAAVILVSDGKETCGADPCALGRALKKNGIDFTVHVVGFGVKRVEEKGLRCLAKETGGIYVRADDPKSLARAIGKSVREVQQPADVWLGKWSAESHYTQTKQVVKWWFSISRSRGKYRIQTHISGPETMEITNISATNLRFRFHDPLDSRINITLRSRRTFSGTIIQPNNKALPRGRVVGKKM